MFIQNPDFFSIQTLGFWMPWWSRDRSGYCHSESENPGPQDVKFLLISGIQFSNLNSSGTLMFNGKYKKMTCIRRSSLLRRSSLHDGLVEVWVQLWKIWHHFVGSTIRHFVGGTIQWRLSMWTDAVTGSCDRTLHCRAENWKSEKLKIEKVLNFLEIPVSLPVVIGGVPDSGKMLNR